jgi:hypothetical protein
VVSNVYGGAFRPWQLIWPLTLIVLGLLLFKRSITLAFFVALGGATAMVSNYPFYYHQFDQYHGDQGDRPYQALIDYANNNGALTYWAHPDAPNWESPRQIGPVKIETPPYASSLLHTKGYTGFAIFAEGMHSAGLPGHEWDQTLLEYCNGERTQPVWSIGELDYGGKKSFLLNEITNFVYVKNKSAQDILSSLKAGKNYVRWTPNKAAWIRYAVILRSIRQ